MCETMRHRTTPFTHIGIAGIVLLIHTFMAFAKCSAQLTPGVAMRLAVHGTLPSFALQITRLFTPVAALRCETLPNCHREELRILTTYKEFTVWVAISSSAAEDDTKHNSEPNAQHERPEGIGAAFTALGCEPRRVILAAVV